MLKEMPSAGLDMDRLAGRGGGGLIRVGVDQMMDLASCPPLHGQDVLGDQLGGLGADDVDPVSPPSGSLKDQAKPSVSAEATALPEAVKGNLPTL